MSTIRIEQVAKRFGDTVVVADVSLDVRDGELIALLGPSGSGKTTLLRMIAGFETVDAGRILLDGEDVTARSALHRRVGMVFQHYALFPHLTVGDNVGYGLADARLTRAERSERVAEALALVNMHGYEARAVTALSGGQQQRVALARALAPRPRILLLDEPLSNLDPSLRERTRAELRTLVRRIGITTVLVTHEQEEAFDLADRIALLHLGRLEQLGVPDVLYQQPATPFVAQFVGRASWLTGVASDARVVRAAGVDWHAPHSVAAGAAVRLAVRPEGVRFSAGAMHGVVVHRRFAGALAYFVVRLVDGEILEVAAAPDAASLDDPVTIEPTGTGAFAWAAPAE
jgi:ABC-type Fe3+/spermidine/putrescine transport system ATPase subunit